VGGDVFVTLGRRTVPPGSVGGSGHGGRGMRVVDDVPLYETSVYDIPGTLTLLAMKFKVSVGKQTSSVYSSALSSALWSSSSCSRRLLTVVRIGSSGTSGSTMELARIDLDKGLPIDSETPLIRRCNGSGGAYEVDFGLPESEC
jgi:hypothetical protein